MTSPSGHGGDINLAALWVPVMPETSHMGEKMRQAGREAKRDFESGFNSGQSPEAMGNDFTSRFSSSFKQGMSKLELPFGMSTALDKLGGDIDKNLVNKLKGEATSALQSYRQEWDNLQAAQQRSSVLETEIANRRQAGLGAHSIIPLMQQQTAATREVEEATSKAGAAHEQYSSKLTKLNEIQSAAGTGGQVLAGIMGGAVVAGVQMSLQAIEKLVEIGLEALVETFKMSVEAGKELAEQLVEIGEAYEAIDIQTQEFSNKSGAALTELEEHASAVFDTLDVAGKNTGQTMAQFASMLEAEPGPALDMLTKHTEELQGRFTNLRSANLASIFVAFKTPVEEADSALASLLQSARGAGQGVGDLVNALSGDAAVTLSEAGLSIQQAGAFMSELLNLGAPGRSIMIGLQSAMKEFGKEGLSFGDGMKLAGERLKELGDTAEGQELSEKLFGSRRWAVAMQAVQQYLDVVEQSPAAFDASSDSLDQFNAHTETLENKWEEVKHKAEEAFKPVGIGALSLVGTALDGLVGAFDRHKDEIKAKVVDIGHSFINILPDIQTFAAEALGFLAEVINPLKEMAYVITIPLIGAGQLIALLHGDLDQFNKLGDLGDKIGKLDDKDLSVPIKNAAKAVQDFKIDTKDLNTELDKLSGHDPPPAFPMPGLAPSAYPTSPSATGTTGIPGLGLVTGAVPASVPSGISNLPGGVPVPSGVMPPGIGTLPGGVPVPGSVVAPRSATSSYADATSPDQVKALAQQLFPWPASEWPAFDALEMKEAGYNPHAANASGAYGIGQFMPGTWAKYGARTDDPAQQIMYMFSYIRDRYGSPSAAWAQYYNHPKGEGSYATGGIAGMHPGMPSGTDTVPAWLTPGERVFDVEKSMKWKPLFDAIHNDSIKYYDKGTGDSGHSGQSGVLQVIYDNLDSGQKTGEAGGQYVGPGTNQPQYYAADWGGHTGHVHTSFATGPDGQPYGLPRGTDIRQGGPGFPPWVYAIGAQFGVEASTYPGHQESSGLNRGIDWWPKGHADMSGLSYTKEERARLQTFASTVSSLGVGAGGPSLPRGGDGPAAWGGDGSTPSGQTGAYYPGMPGQYGGGGVYGGETEDQRRAAEKSVRDAQQRKDDLDYQAGKQQRHIDELNKAISDMANEKGLLGQPVKDTPERQSKRQGLQDQLDDAMHQQAVSQRESADADEAITDAKRKQQEAMYKKPGGQAQEYKVPGASEFQQLGGGLLKGIGQELGFGDIFSKAPWEWGIFKLFAGMTNWGVGTANAWAEEIGKGHTGMTGFQPMAGFDQQGSGGLMNLLGGMFPSAQALLPKPVMVDQFGRPATSAGPNVVPGSGTDHDTSVPAHHVIQGDYMPINVQAGVDPAQILKPVQEQQNSNAGQMHRYTGGLPQ